MDETCALIMQLELKLLHTDLRANPAVVDELLDDDFEEIGNAGQVTNRAQVVQWLLNKDSTQRWHLADFRIKLVSSDTVIAIYHARKQEQVDDSRNDGTAALRTSIRSSVWQRRGEHWKMVFHQVTQRV